jgi:peroxiredoxin
VPDRRSLFFCVVAALLSLIACSEEGSSESRAEPHGRPLPAFSGYTLAGKRFDVASLIGKRAVLFFFNPDVPGAADAARAVVSVARDRAANNFEVVGIGMAADSARLQAFATKQGFDFPVVDDSSSRIAGQLGVPAPLLLVGVDPEGNVSFLLPAVVTDVPDAAGFVEANLRKSMRLPAVGPAVTPALGERPKAPLFTAERLDGGARFELASLRGQPVVLVFFLHTCPHCHAALETLKEQLAQLPEASRPSLVGISVQNKPAAVRARMESDGLDFFPILLDPDFTVARAYGAITGVPDIFLIDAGGSVVARFNGWREDRDPPLIRMWLAKLAGQPVPMLLHSTGYSGNEFCAVCHELEQETWTLTQHAGAFDTLVRHSASTNAECVGCHVVGFGQPGGYTISPPTPYLENVGCESCHGRGGPHLSPGFVKDGHYEGVCVTCHDPTHSLGFDYATFHPRISHAANAQLAALPLAEKQKLLAERGRPRSDLLPQTATYVGSKACAPCHASEYAIWEKSPHAHAVASLEAKGETANGTCLTCHTTAYGRPGGFPEGAVPADHPDLARVGCESCHGPGGDHVGPDAARRGTIVSLEDKCDSCVILQICGTCHDDANDPGFEFEVIDKIEAQRHHGKPPKAARSDGAAGAESLRAGPPKAARSDGAAGAESLRAGPPKAARSDGAAGALPASALVGALEEAFRRADAADEPG